MAPRVPELCGGLGMLEVEQEAPFGQISLAPPPTQPTVQ